MGWVFIPRTTIRIGRSAPRCPVTFLIDGYNLLHAVGLASRRFPPKGLERARTRFLDWLADAMRERDDILRVVFDAQNGPLPSSEYGHRGVRVRFAYRQTADELIDEMIHAVPHPARVTVVSNDGQVQDAGRRRGCPVLTCQEFVDWLIDDHPGAGPPPPEDDKPAAAATPAEMAAWLEAFSVPRTSPKRRPR
ncbi:MAG: YacP-like domain protein [Gemmataceae bacterium]|nr:YacP-like domain protein [Gemmataceae bacterium]